MSSDTPASESRGASATGTLADHVREAKRLVNAIDRSSSPNARQYPDEQPVGTTGSRHHEAAHGTEPSAPAAAAQADSGRNDIVTVDRTRVKELKQQIEAIERLEPKS